MMQRADGLKSNWEQANEEASENLLRQVRQLFRAGDAMQVRGLGALVFKYEYKVDGFHFRDDGELEARLNGLGQEGWGLMSIKTRWDDEIEFVVARCVFKRPVHPVAIFGAVGGA